MLSFGWLSEGGTLESFTTSSKPSSRTEVPNSLETSEHIARKDMSDTREHPTAGRRRRHKSPAVGQAVFPSTLPSLPDHLRAVADGPSCSDDEKGAKRLRSASTTPRSVRGTDPDEYDRVMGVTSVDSHETARFGGKKMIRR